MMEKLMNESVPKWKKPQKLMRNTPTGPQEALHATFIDGTQPRPVVIVGRSRIGPTIAPTVGDDPIISLGEPVEDEEPELEPIVITEPVVLTEAERERLRQEKKKARRLARKEKEKAGK